MAKYASSPDTTRTNSDLPDTELVAIVGIGCRLPGGVTSPEPLWRVLHNSVNAVTDIPGDRWDADAYYDPEPSVPGRMCSRWGGFLDDVGGFDTEFFTISRAEALAMDPQQRVLLEVAWEALEQAGIPPASVAGTRTGVYTGMSTVDYLLRSQLGGAASSPYSATGNAHSVASGRISYLLGAHGPAVSVDTACSSSLLAVNMAARSLLSGETDMALAGGINLVLGPETGVAFSNWGMLSPRGRCAPFDAEADGFVRAEGCGIIVLKRLSDAVRAGDRVLALIRGGAVNQDGRSNGLTQPSQPAQEALLREALASTGIDPAQIGLVETHGTGTPVGDPVEFGALAAVYGTGKNPCALGSIKSNIGHLEAASGIAGLIKAVLCLQHGVIPPNLHFRSWNPSIDHGGSRFFVPTETVSWPVPDGPRLAAVSSFGFSGTNAHVLLQSAAPAALPRQRTARTAADVAGAHAAQATPVTPVTLVTPVAETTPVTEATPVTETAPAARDVPHPLVIPVSASSPAALARTADSLADWLDDHVDVALRDVGWTLARRRGNRQARLAITAADRGELVEQLRGFARGEASPATESRTTRVRVPGPVFVFSGQGSQWAGMGRELLEREAAFAATIAQVEPLVQDESGFSVTGELTSAAPSAAIDRVQPVIFAMQVALAATWRAHGVEPAGVLGHSMGEAAAAVVSGALSLADGVKVICRRSRLMRQLSGSGRMASVELSAADLDAELAAAGIDDVVVAVLAAPTSTVVAGDAERVSQLVAGWEARGLFAREIAVDVASHSSQVDPILPDLVAALGDLAPREPAIPFFSTVLGDPLGRPSFDGPYWSDNLRRPVRFASAVTAALDDGQRCFVEVAPHPLLLRSITETIAKVGRDAAVVETMRRGDDVHRAFLTRLGAVHCAGVAVDWSLDHPSGRLVDLPATAWHHEHLMIELADATSARVVAVHPLLGVHVQVPSAEGGHVWQADAGTAALPWLADHQVRDAVVLPGAGYCEMALAAATQIFGAGTATEIVDIEFRGVLFLDDHTPLSLVADYQAEDQATLRIVSLGTDEVWAEHAVARARRVPRPQPPAPVDVEAALREHPTAGDVDAFYERLRATGIHHGPNFAGLTAIHYGDTNHRGDAATSTVLGRLELPTGLRAEASAFRLHPVVLDSCLQTLAAHPSLAMARDAADGLSLPLGVGTLRVYGDTSRGRYCLARLTRQEATAAFGDLTLLAADGTVLAELHDVHLGGASANPADLRFARRLLGVDWEERPLPPSAGEEAVAGSWLLLSEQDDPQDITDEVVVGLRARGLRAEAVRLPAGEEGDRAQTELVAEWLRTVPDWGGLVFVAPGAASRVDPRVDPHGLTRARDRVRRLALLVRALVEDNDTAVPRLWVLTRDAQPVFEGEGTALDAGALRGLYRVISYEHAELKITHLDVDATAGGKDLCAELCAGLPDDEVAWRAGNRYLARLRTSPLRDGDRRTQVRRFGRDGITLGVRQPGDLDSFEFVARDRRSPGPGEIEIELRAASINFADVLNAMGVYQTADGKPIPLGTDGAGTVTAVGPGVASVQPGDRVAVMDFGALGTFHTTRAARAFPVPDSMTLEAAAALPAVYLTAWYGLHELAGLRAGERVLIHAASGGVGLAAIAIARAAGAEILATAGSERKRAYLRELGIRHVFDSRSARFAEQIRELTGDGVDVVLNSLTGPALRAGLDLLRVGGRFIELGKRDIYSDAKLGMFPFRRNITFASVDLGLLGTDQPALLDRLVREVGEELAAGRLTPLEYTAFPIAEASAVFRSMGAGEHIGKLVLTIPADGETTVVVAPHDIPVIRGDGAYVVTGGLGGLGLVLARWLSRSGAGRVVLNGRSAPSSAAEAVLAELRGAGTDIEVVRGDIAVGDTAQRLVAAATATGLPLRGVLHGAAVVEDAVVTLISDELLDRVWQPKVVGAWRLHEACEGHDLDWWFGFSSAAALLGFPGQGSYAAANAWLDTFTSWRRAQGLPAISVNWGAWADHGRGASFEERGYAMIDVEEGLDACERLLRHDRARAGYLPVDQPTWLAHFGATIDSTFLATVAIGGGTSGGQAANALLDELGAADPATRQSLLETYLIGEVSGILRIDRAAIDPRTPLLDVGMDSLMMLELRTRIEKGLGLRVATKVLWAHSSPTALAAHLADRLDQAAVANPVPAPAPSAPAPGTTATATATSAAALRTVTPTGGAAG
ncbi:SDR family NAD(P)-dependent oxidoreductase [Parafrankia sp. FMc2]|uniref:SDR family NAD(P)-dependent oxidoreductase n=1 Tax=Parafrankia sp. FMc2 TaxID=3233196 RepID=UPI0034D5BED3